MQYGTALTIIACLVGVLSLTSVFNLNISAIFSRPVDIKSELRPLLSPDASISVLGDKGFAAASERWQWWGAPNVSAIVNVKTEKDIQETVLYANKHNVSFLASAGTHGTTSALGNMESGIQINLRALNQVKVSSDGTYTTLGGGIKVKEVIRALWAQDKVTVTGGCECVGMTAVILGGGHGFLQGYHGLLSDQLLSARLILANGTSITASATSHPDIFWALQGAGHNFGIITQSEYRVYDATPNLRLWSHTQFYFTSRQVERVFKLAEEMMETQPRGVMHYAVFLKIAEMDAENPVIQYNIIFNGPLSALQTYAANFYAIGSAITVTENEGPYVDIPKWVAIDEDGMVCRIQDYFPEAAVVRFPVDVEKYDVVALMGAYEAFGDMMKRVPELSGSFFMVEQYATQGVQEVNDWDASAFPFRGDKLLLAPALVYTTGNTTSKTSETFKLDEMAHQEGIKLRNIIHRGTGRPEKELHSYINYAYGDEGSEAFYGYEPWRMEKLRRLKREYDPENRFRYYLPIDPGK